jgi:hypothetical protein
MTLDLGKIYEMKQGRILGSETVKLEASMYDPMYVM